MLTALVSVVILAAIAVVVVLLARALRATSVAGLQLRISKLEERFDDHDYAHERLSRSIDNLHQRVDRIPDQVVDRLSKLLGH